MKKLLLLMCCAFSLSGYGQTTKLALNGISQDTAQAWVNKFAKQNVRKPLMTSVWFSKKMIQSTLALLASEKKTGNTPFTPDGIRIYYGSNANNQNTVILVSTFDNGLDPATKKEIHQDYFDHDTNSKDGAELFKNSGDITGAICNDNSCGGGAKLYRLDTDPRSDGNCDNTAPHYITILYAEEMVWNFGNALINSENEWFDLDILKAFANAATPDDGIRIYFGKHSALDLNYPGQDAFVIVTTQAGKTPDIHEDYFNCDDTKPYFSSVNKLTLENSKIAGKIKKATKPIKYMIEDSGQDNGEICPTHCNGPVLKPNP